MMRPNGEGVGKDSSSGAICFLLPMLARSPKPQTPERLSFYLTSRARRYPLPHLLLPATGGSLAAIYAAMAYIVTRLRGYSKCRPSTCFQRAMLMTYLYPRDLSCFLPI